MNTATRVTKAIAQPMHILSLIVEPFVWIDVNMSNQEIIRLLRENPHIIYTVADKNLDNIIGTISLKDLFNN